MSWLKFLVIPIAQAAEAVEYIGNISAEEQDSHNDAKQSDSEAPVMPEW